MRIILWHLLMFDKLNDYLMLSFKKGYAATILLALASHAEAEGKRIIFTLLSSNNPEIFLFLVQL